MFITIVLSILALITIAGVALGLTPQVGEDRVIAWITAGVAGFIGVVLAAFNMIVIVQGYEVGVPVAFGQVGQPIGSGLHVIAPWTGVETYPTRPLTVPDVRITARTAQAGQVNVVAGARWSVVAKDARELYFQVRTGDEDFISQTIVDKALGQAIGNAFSGMSNSDAVSDRTQAETKLKDTLSELVAPYGIQVNSLFLRSVEPDAKTADSIARLAAQQRATQIAAEAQNTATAEAKRRLIDAGGLKAAAEQVAGVTPAEVQAICAQAWERQQQAATDAKSPMYTTPCGGSPSLAVR